MPEEEAAPVVAVTRAVGGALLVIIGFVAAVAGALWYFVVPWFGWARDDIWYALSEWADIGGAVVGIGGFILFVIGAALVQRARKRRLQIFIDPADVTSPTPERPSTTPPPIV